MTCCQPSCARSLELEARNARAKLFSTPAARSTAKYSLLSRDSAPTGSLHPMQTFSGRGIPNLKNVTLRRRRRSSRPDGRSANHQSSSAACPSQINGKDKPAYHATAVLVCGSEFALMEAAIRILTRIGFTRRRALQTLLPLTRQMLDNIQRLGPRAAWTGPMSRGDYAIVAKHAKALRKYPREYLDAYAALRSARRKSLVQEFVCRDQAAKTRALEWLKILM